jgi:hypothetical protein
LGAQQALFKRRSGRKSFCGKFVCAVGATGAEP